MEQQRAAGFRAHLELCPSCAGYHAVVQRGVAIVRELPPLEPSCDFLPKLQHRIYHLEDERRRPGTASGSSAAFVVAIAAVIGVAAWAPALRPRPPVLKLAPVVAHAPHRDEAIHGLFRPGPLLLQEARPAPAPSLLFHYTPLGASAGPPLVHTLRAP